AGFNWSDPVALAGWAIPAATDIAFALGFLALAASRAPTSLKIFLLAVAIIDDLAAIVIIALFYTADLSMTAFGLAVVGVAVLFALNRMGVKATVPYIIVGAIIWVCVLKSGIHATLAGVVTALAIPMTGKGAKSQSPLHKLEHGLHPWVAFMVLPIFAFANAGLSFDGLTFAALFAPVPLGIALGLFIGKPLGVMSMAALAIKLGVAKMPDGMSWRHLAGVAWLTGVGFTMSLFIGGLAFDEAALINEVRLGVLAGSLASAAAACMILANARATQENSERAGKCLAAA
ncbi:MAG: Na+/H+ antiporter NhaA, partial [Marinicaulis sp.]|nr:Na+/H+ antiporter NhaA [Marinicaulis sp.]